MADNGRKKEEEEGRKRKEEEHKWECGEDVERGGKREWEED